jgi:phytoene dehydrogenase-like protein
MTNHESSVVVIGGGLSGLLSAALLSRRGVPVVVVERAPAPGGRAATREKQGFSFNLGPHALYRRGVLKRTLHELGVEITGGVATGSGGYAIAGGRVHTLPIGLSSLMTTGAIGLAGKVEFARLYAKLSAVKPDQLQRTTLASWLDANFHDTAARQLLEMTVRVTTFTNDPQHHSAGAAIEQLQLGLQGSVLYVDGGWQTIVDGIRREAVAAGARIITGASAAALERSDARTIDAVRLADRSVLRASAVILTGSPADVEHLAGVTGLAASLPPPIRVATLDVALRSLPKPRHTVAFGVDVPLYFSVHSALARLAPDGGAVIHATKYLRSDETADRETERELEELMTLMQPGWRDQLKFKQFLPHLVVTHAEATAAIGGVGGRPSARLAAFDNVAIAGDWVGPRGQLSDACAASAADAVSYLRPHATSVPGSGTEVGPRTKVADTVLAR